MSINQRAKALRNAWNVLKTYDFCDNVWEAVVPKSEVPGSSEALSQLFKRLDQHAYFGKFEEKSVGVLPEKAAYWKEPEMPLTHAMVEDIPIPNDASEILDPYDVMFWNQEPKQYEVAVRGTRAIKDIKGSTGKDGFLGWVGQYGHGKLVDISGSLGIEWPGGIKESIAIMLTQETAGQKALCYQFKERISQCRRGTVMYISGHSLGGALAVAYAMIAKASGIFSEVYLDIYGAFPILDETAAKAFDKSGIICNNYQYATDAVPQMVSLKTALLYRSFSALDLVKEWQKNDKSQLTVPVGTIHYGNFAPADDHWPLTSHGLKAYIDGFLSEEDWKSWQEFERHNKFEWKTTIRPADDATRLKAVDLANEELNAQEGT